MVSSKSSVPKYTAPLHPANSLPLMTGEPNFFGICNDLAYRGHHDGILNPISRIMTMFFDNKIRVMSGTLTELLDLSIARCLSLMSIKEDANAGVAEMSPCRESFDRALCLNLRTGD